MSGKKPIKPITTTTEDLNVAAVQQKIAELQVPNLNSLITKLIIKHIKKSGSTGKDTYLSLENLTQQFPDKTPANQLNFLDSLNLCVSKIIEAKDSKKNPLLSDAEITRYTQDINMALGRGSHGFAISFRALASILNNLAALNDDKQFEFILKEILQGDNFLTKFQKQTTARTQKECLDEFITKITQKYREYEQAQQALETNKVNQQHEDTQKLNDVIAEEANAKISNKQDELREQNNIDQSFIIETEKLTRKNAQQEFLEEQNKIIEQLELGKKSILAKQALDQTRNNQDNLGKLISEENIQRTTTQQEALQQQEAMFRKFSIDKEQLDRSSIEQNIAKIQQEIQKLDQTKLNILKEEATKRTDLLAKENTESNKFTNQINQFNLLNKEQQQRYKIVEETQQNLQNHLISLEGLLRTSIQSEEKESFAKITSLSNLAKNQTEQNIQLKNIDKLLQEIINTITTANITQNYTDPEHKNAIDALNTCINKINTINAILNQPSNLQHIAYTDFQGFNTQYLIISDQIKLLLGQNISSNQVLKEQATTELTNLLEKIKTYTIEQRTKELLKEMVAKEITHLIYDDLHKQESDIHQKKQNITEFKTNLLNQFKAQKDELSQNFPENLIKQVFLLKCLGCDKLSDFVNLNDPIKGWFSTTTPEPTETYVTMLFNQLSNMMKQSDCKFLHARSSITNWFPKVEKDSEAIAKLTGTEKEKLTELLTTNNIPDKPQAIKSASTILIGTLSKLQEISGTEKSASWEPELIDLELEKFQIIPTLEAYTSDNLIKIDYTITENLKKLSQQNNIDKEAYEQLQKLLKPQIELAKQKESSERLANDLIKIIKEVHELRTKEYNNNTSEISNSLIKLSNDLPHKLARIF